MLIPVACINKVKNKKNQLQRYVDYKTPVYQQFSILCVCVFKEYPLAMQHWLESFGPSIRGMLAGKLK